MRRLMIQLCVLALVAAAVPAQDSGASLLSASRKRARDAVGLKKIERPEVWKDCIRILAMIPEKFPKQRAAVARSYLETGRMWRRLGRPEMSEKVFQKVLETPEEQRLACDALHDLASLYRRSKKADAAMAALGRIVSDFPTQGMSRARALVRLAGLHRDTKSYARAEALLRRCLEDHGDLWRQAVDALNALVSLKIRQGEFGKARSVLDAHTDALRARFEGTPQGEKIDDALMAMTSRVRLVKIETGGPGGGGHQKP